MSPPDESVDDPRDAKPKGRSVDWDLVEAKVLDALRETAEVGRSAKPVLPAPLGERLEIQEELGTGAFEARKGGIIFKTILRGLTKYLTKKGVEEKEGALAGWLVNAFNVATETADTRSWTTLPQSVRMSRLWLPEGVHEVTVTLYDADADHQETFTIPDVKITRGQSTFLNYRVY